MAESIEKLRNSEKCLSVRVRNLKSVKEQFKTINLTQAEREKVIINLRQQVERQKVNMQLATNEHNKKTISLVKLVNSLVEAVKKHQPRFKGHNYVDDLRKEAEEKVNFLCIKSYV